jgi:hypothetical protein
LTDEPADQADWAEPYRPGTTKKKYPWLIMADDAKEATDVHACDPCPPGDGTTAPPGVTTTTTPAPLPWTLWRSQDLATCYCQRSDLPPMSLTDNDLGQFVDEPACLSTKNLTCDFSQWYIVQLNSGGYQCFDAQGDLIGQGTIVNGPFNQALDCFKAKEAVEATTTPAPGPGVVGGPCQ